MQIRLIVEKGSKTRSVFVVSEPDMVIGRQKGCQLRIPSSEVSRRHCQLTLVPGGLLVRDLGSSNGTLLNDREVQGEQEVRSGDRLQVGPVTFLVEFLTEQLVEGDVIPHALGQGFELVEESTPTSLEKPATTPSSGGEWDLPIELDNE